MARSETPRDLIATHVAAVALTPLIPIPFADDLVATGFRRRLVRKLSQARGSSLSERAVRVLADRPGTGIFARVGRAFTYPIRRIFRKIFFVLEWKRALETLGDDFVRAELIDTALERGWAQRHGAERLSAALERTVAAADMNVFQRAARAVLTGSGELVRAGVAQLASRLRGTAEEPDVAARALDGETGRGGVLDQLAAQLERVMAALPGDYLPALQRRLEAELAA